jgi:hypothetical protein
MFHVKDMHERSASNIGSNWEGSKRRDSHDPTDRMITMRRAAIVVVIFVVMRAAHAAAPQHPSPVIVELFTSEGCSSCPAADALLLRLVEQPIDGVQTIVLGEHVDYWDRLGWKDRFSSPAFTRRQEVYANRFNLDSAYTPQVVVDGRSELVGSDRTALQRAIQRAHREAHGAVGVVVRARGALDDVVGGAVECEYEFAGVAGVGDCARSARAGGQTRSLRDAERCLGDFSHRDRRTEKEGDRSNAAGAGGMRTGSESDQWQRGHQRASGSDAGVSDGHDGDLR